RRDVWRLCHQRLRDRSRRDRRASELLRPGAERPMTNPAETPRITHISIHVLTLELRVPFTTSFGTFKTLTRPCVVLETEDGLRGLGEIPTMTDPSYKAESDTASVLTSLKEFILPSVGRYQTEHGPIAAIEQVQASYAWIKGAVFAKSGL